MNCGYIGLGSSLLEFRGPGFDFHSGHTFSMYFICSFLFSFTFNFTSQTQRQIKCLVPKKTISTICTLIYIRYIQIFNLSLSVCLSVCLSPPSRNFSFQPTVTMFKCFSIVDLISSIIISYQMKCPQCSNSIMILTIKDLTYALQMN